MFDSVKKQDFCKPHTPTGMAVLLKEYPHTQKKNSTQNKWSSIKTRSSKWIDRL